MGWRVGVPAAFAVAGLLLAASAQTAQGRNLRPGDRGDLVSLIQNQQRQLERTQAEVEALRGQVRAAGKAVSSGDVAATDFQRRADLLAQPAGLDPVRGPGVTVRLDDAPLPAGGQPTRGNLPLDAYVVHEQDLQAVVNALWRGGAEAMQVQDQRVVATSAIRCVGNTLLLQGRTYTPPYTITAVGDVTALRRALDEDPSVRTYRDYVAEIGLGYKVTEHDEVTLPGFTGPLTLTYARISG